MSDPQPNAPAPTPEPASPPATPAPPVAPPEPPTAPSPWENPEAARAEIERLRRENAADRTAAKTAAADAVRQEYTDKIAVALGLKPDAATDPAALAAQITEAQASAAKAARELAIFKAASTSGADPSRLLDSNSFMSSVAGLDPNDGAAVSAAIQAALTANPLLKAVQAAAASGTELGGSQETGQITEQQLAAMTDEEKHAALKEGKLAHFFLA
jgi:hypothetical protein